MEKYSRMNIPDNIYKRVVNFFKDHSHCTQYGEIISQSKMISASIIQGLDLGPAFYVVTASDLQPVTLGNTIVKYADDTYLVVPADSVHSFADEIIHVERFSGENDLSLTESSLHRSCLFHHGASERW